MSELTYEDIQALREDVCEGCAGDHPWRVDTCASEHCEEWQAAVAEQKKAIATEAEHA